MTTASHLRSSVHLDLIRGLLAFAVIAGHVRNLFLVDHGEVAQRSPLLTVVYALTGLGHQAVIGFFVLSGFFITASFMRQSAQPAWAAYAIDRLSRLYVVLLPCLALTLFWDGVGQRYAAEPAVYEGRHPGNMTISQMPVRETTGVAIFFGNLAFTQTILVPSLGSNGPLWSLANEFWYYIAGPLLFIGCFPRRRLPARLASIAVVAGVLVFVGPAIALLFPIWLFGAAVYLLPPLPVLRRPFIYRLGLTATGCAVTAAIYFTRRYGATLPVEYALGLTASAFLYVLLHGSAAAGAGAYTAVARTSANMSFTMYASHLPFLVAIYAVIAGSGRWQPTVDKLLICAVVLCAGAVYSWALAQLTERHTNRIRDWVRRLVGIKSARAESVSGSRKVDGEPPHEIKRATAQSGEPTRS